VNRNSVKSNSKSQEDVRGCERMCEDEWVSVREKRRMKEKVVLWDVDICRGG